MTVVVLYKLQERVVYPSSHNYASTPETTERPVLLPVTATSVERANSALKFVKTDRQNRMGDERLNALLLLFMHKDIDIDLDRVVDIFASRRPRRMLFTNPLSEVN